MLIRDFACAMCGAPRRTLDDAVVVICLHCGAMVAFASDATPLAERHAAGIQQLVKPKAPVEDAVAMQEIATFDPKITALMGELGRASMTIMTGDPVTGARAMLAAARAYYAALAIHPDCPPGALREGSDHLAREVLRQSIGGHASLLGNQAIERIRVEVLGDKASPTPTCPKCGGSLEPGLARCPHCGAVTSSDNEDTWTTAQLNLWQISRADLVRRDELDGPKPVITAVGGFIHTGARDVPAAKAAAFLRRAIPWLVADDLHRGLAILATALTPDQRTLLDGIRHELRDWQPDPTTRPARPATPTEFPPPTAAEEAAWIEAALALFHLRRSSELVELLAQPLSAMQIAAVHAQATAVSPRAALAFFERAFPDFSRPMMRNEVIRLSPGYDHPRVRAFLTDLAALLC